MICLIVKYSALYKKWIVYINRRRKEKLYHSLSAQIVNGKKRESNTHKEIDVKQIKHLEANIVEVMSPLIIDYRIDSINNLYLRINEISKNLFEKFSAIEGKSLVIYHQISREKIVHHKLTLRKTIKYVTEIFFQLYDGGLLPELKNGGYDLLKTIAEYIAFNSFPEDEKYMQVIEEEKQTIIKEFGYVPKEIKKMIQQDIFVNVVIDML